MHMAGNVSGSIVAQVSVLRQSTADAVVGPCQSTWLVSYLQKLMCFASCWSHDSQSCQSAICLDVHAHSEESLYLLPSHSVSCLDATFLHCFQAHDKSCCLASVLLNCAAAHLWQSFCPMHAVCVPRELASSTVLCRAVRSPGGWGPDCQVGGTSSSLPGGSLCLVSFGMSHNGTSLPVGTAFGLRKKGNTHLVVLMARVQHAVAFSCSHAATAKGKSERST